MPFRLHTGLVYRLSYSKYFTAPFPYCQWWHVMDDFVAHRPHV
jgi:hypothetical protein